MAGRVGDPRSLPPEEAPQDAALQGLEQRALAHPLVPEQLELDPGLRQLAGTQLLDVAQLVVVLVTEPLLRTWWAEPIRLCSAFPWFLYLPRFWLNALFALSFTCKNLFRLKRLLNA